MGPKNLQIRSPARSATVLPEKSAHGKIREELAIGRRSNILEIDRKRGGHLMARARLWLAAAVFLAAGLSALAWEYQRLFPLVPVLVAVEDIPAGAVAGSASVQLRHIPIGGRMPDVLTDHSELQGFFTTAVFAGQQVPARSLGSQSPLEERIAAELEAGRRLTSLRVGSEWTLPGSMQPGDRLTVYVGTGAVISLDDEEPPWDRFDGVHLIDARNAQGESVFDGTPVSAPGGLGGIGRLTVTAIVISLPDGDSVERLVQAVDRKGAVYLELVKRGGEKS